MPSITAFGSEWDPKRRQSKFWVELDTGAGHAGFGQRLPEARRDLQTQLAELKLPLIELGPYGLDLAAEIEAWEKQIQRFPGGRAAEAAYDYVRAMRHGAKLTVDFIEGPSVGTLAVEQIGEVVLTNGRISAGDPDQDRQPAFTRRVKPGRYPVFVSWAELPDEPRRRSVLAWMQFSKAPVMRWEQALTEDQLPSQLAPGEMFGVSVDSGCSSWADAGVEGVELFDDEPLEESAQRGDHLVAFTTGWGDGQYACFWGLDARGGEAVLVMDVELVRGAEGLE
jgi:hypothetical protein